MTTTANELSMRRRAVVAVTLLAVLTVGLAMLTMTRESQAAVEGTPWPNKQPEGQSSAWVDPATAGHPWGEAVSGILTFRGNPTRNYYGQGPVPTNPVVRWSYPESPMCSESSVEQGDHSGTFNWCGSGWTGQPSVFERDGRTWVVFGAYDKAVHFLDADTGEQIIPSFPTGDIIKGSVTVDPDGFPLVYSGSRDNYFHILAIDGDEPRELWSFDANSVDGLWNDDWDGSALVIDDYLFEGGENSLWFIWKLNRSFDDEGLVTVDPTLVFMAPGWDEELLEAVGDENVSIENSVAISGDVIYFGNSGGLIQGWDISGVKHGRDPERVFRFWAGDDTDASVVIDEEGFLYVVSEVKRHTERSAEIGQILKLDPRQNDDPIVWSLADPDNKGIWATPAIYRDLLIVPTDGGRIMAVDRNTGTLRWEFFMRGPTWQSPVVVDDVLIQGDCRGGVLSGFDLTDTTTAPPKLWSVPLGGCVESTPAVWDGQIFVGTRGGHFFAIGENRGTGIMAPGGN